MTELALTAPGAGVLAASLADAAAQVLALAEVHRRAGQVALEGADIPRRTGHLAASATVAVAADGFTLTDPATYAGYVHARDPFFTEALHRRADEVAEVYAGHVTDTLTEIRGG